MSGQPARGYSWRPFDKANTAAVKSGAYSPRKVAEFAEALRPTLAGPLESCPWIEETDGAEVTDWLEREAMKNMLMGELARRMAENGGRLADADKWLLERIGAAQNRVQASRDRLLLNPLYRFRAGRDVAGAGVDLARMWADDPGDAVNATQAAVQAAETED